MTRRERYLERRRRYMQRRRRAAASGWAWELVFGGTPGHWYWVRQTRKHKLTSPGKQSSQDVSSNSYDNNAGEGVVNVPTPTFEVSEVGRNKPPHVKLTGGWGTYWSTRSWRPHEALIGYHRRRVDYYGHRPWRMNGEQRKIWGAGYFAYNNGYFPDWDPLERHPTEQEVLDGADPYLGPFPQTPRE